MVNYIEIDMPRSCLVPLLCLLFVSIAYSQQTPKSYIAYRSFEKFNIDGLADESSWHAADKSDLFIDIEGKKKPKQETFMKMVWDSTYLYVFAKLSESHIWGNLKQRDTIIFYNNDFEIFIDPDGDSHNYYELEVNALNTVWDLFLSKPYRNQGTVLGDWDFKGLRSAIHIDGTMNDASDIDKSWSVEIAIPWSFKTAPGRETTVPENKFWRMNFSRVNWQFEILNGKYYRKKDVLSHKFLPEYNWVWSPQEVINMHEPERWGYVYFANQKPTNKATFEIPKDEHLKWFLYELFKAYSKNKDQSIIQPKKILGKQIVPKLHTTPYGWAIVIQSPFTKKEIFIRDNGKLSVL